MFKNPAEFWKDSEIGKKSVSKMPKYIRPYALPNEEHKGRNTFKALIALVVSKYSKGFLRGFIDLDQYWEKSKHPEVSSLRKKYSYPKPYCERRVYVCRARVEIKTGPDRKTIIKHDDGSPIQTISIYPPKKEGQSYWGNLQVNGYNNKELGWTVEEGWKNEISAAPKKLDAATGLPIENDEPEETIENGFKYFNCSAWIPETVAEPLISYVETGLKKLEDLIKQKRDAGDPNIPVMPDAIYFFAITSPIKKTVDGKYKGKISFSLDDYLIMK